MGCACLLRSLFKISLLLLLLRVLLLLAAASVIGIEAVVVVDVLRTKATTNGLMDEIMHIVCFHC